MKKTKVTYQAYRSMRPICDDRYWIDGTEGSSYDESRKKAMDLLSVWSGVYIDVNPAK